ncbi:MULTISPECIES: dynamin family protein [Desulfococcus]|uniref:Dynamin family protein n=1 Tax=Desulfococcus multivorans DSM 2059 TaxID=1121405 RepID=S7TDR8_DESML|nr:dynamin family protein [Desulfococcus multivorans]AOY58682.1 conserved uncharacterized protein [Desulfococcus multivorans]AQV00969.1 hypothetical protein B2D07_09465 [Desulfococcus multivorans]EPR35337.1 Dynamin family protein [Desulfococcus multivorans DSM 2059]SJZ46216.1 Dynamin family protein [Desulfococcus multivorans DSM 2059]
MDRYHQVKDQLIGITRDISSLCDAVKAVSGIGEAPIDHWQRTCREIERQVSAEVLRTAVVGPIKSGKSTFVNALFKGDYLKRGAGVVTAIVTRIRRGSVLKATLFFKAWGDINRDIENAMVLFPSSEWRSGEGPFDIRNEADRTDLARALSALSEDRLVTQDARNMNSVLIGAYLEGYDQVRDIVADAAVTREFTGDHFERHKAFTGDDTLAVYLTDIELTIDAGDMDDTIEIADCQGSDSPNPLHLAMIQEYLRVTHLIVYVVSGRTGLRQADIRFLSTIKRMGIIDNTLFLVNFDFDEHESMDDLKRVTDRIREDIALLRPDPEIYVLSALFNLFKAGEAGLPEKDRRRLEHWRTETRLAAFSDDETRRFEAAIGHKLTRERYSLLLNNHLERLGLQLDGMIHWISVGRDMFGKNADETAEIVREIGAHRKKIIRIKSMIKSTLDGAAQKLKQSLKSDVDRFFDKHDGILGEALRFLRSYHLVAADWEHHVSTSGLSSTMYLVFQDVKRTLDGFVAESVNPEIIRFIREEEEKIQAHFAVVAGPYDTMVRDALFEYNQVMAGLGLPPLPESSEPIGLPGMSAVARSVDLKVPPVTAAMQYSAAIRGEAVMRLGMYRIVRFFRKLFKKAPEGSSGDRLMALKYGVSRLKRETEQSIAFSFKDYRENIKFQYLLKLADAASNMIYETLAERFDTHVSDLAGIASHVAEKTADTTDTEEMLTKAEATCRRIADAVAHLKSEIKTLS